MATSDWSRLAPRAGLVHQMADELGFALVGIAPARSSSYADSVRQWIADGHHGEMAYLAKAIEARLDPNQLVHGARSIIAVADFYAAAASAARPRTELQTHSIIEPTSSSCPPDAPDSTTLALHPTTHGRIARYAQGDDYHILIKKRLHQMADDLATKFPEHEFRCTVDTAPILEREHAARAGLGWNGKHTLLIHPVHGSWMVLGLIVTTLAIQTTGESNYPGITTTPTNHCGTCTRCIDACPTSCISPHSIDATRCISYLTLEHRTPIDPSLHDAMGNWIAGCDVCQEVCPFNNPPHQKDSERPTEAGQLRTRGEVFEKPAIHPGYAPRTEGFALIDMLAWTEDDRRKAFAGSALKRIKLDMARRNALIAAGNHLKNHEEPSMHKRIESIAADPTESNLVQHTACQVLERIGR